MVTRRRSQPGRAEALFELAAQRIVEPTRWQAPRQQTRLFQSLDDPHLLLRVAHWDSREAYWAAMQALGGFEPLDALCDGPGERYFFRQLACYEIVSRQAAVVDCILVAAPRGGGGAVRAFNAEVSSQVVRAMPGFVLRTFFQDEDDADHFLVLHGWESPASLERFLTEALPRFAAQLQEQGATLDTFVGRTRAAVDRYGRPADA